ncbi:activating transcription factor 7-interacting protein 1 isoform X2 [Scleropages formosus]|uniref:Activating transcription factor 7 interacting protein n=1 Tax=Scleropages formosus TaxID=113540 RepID=A0A8C9V354_SCLFO|nr:activating transcription factor 7-interacting protein 1-like isoform X2 [Scleropages formosus]
MILTIGLWRKLYTGVKKMDVAVAEEPQKKVFRARKTMKMSDRQQLEFLHNSLPSSFSTTNTSSVLLPPLVNGNHSEEDLTDTEKEGQSRSSNDKKDGHHTSPVSPSPSPLALSLSLSPSPPSQNSEIRTCTPPTSSQHISPTSAVGENEDVGRGSPVTNEKGEETEVKMEKGEMKKNGEQTGLLVGDKEDGHLKSDWPSSLQGLPLGFTTSLNSQDKETTKDSKMISEEAMDTAPAAMVADYLTDDKRTGPALNTTIPSSPSLSPSHAPESDQEVKEGFLVLSEEDENQADGDEEKEKDASVEEQNGETMEREAETRYEEPVEASAAFSSSSPPSTSPFPLLTSSGEESTNVPQGVKRSLSKDTATNGQQVAEERGGKRQKVQGEELEAQLELKISANTAHRHKLEKVVQRLVEEQLRVLQLSVFDRTLQELRERVEKLDCATKHQHMLNTLQAKITRLAKKFGAANQAKENVRRPLEVSSAAVTTSVSSVSSTPTSRAVRMTMESKQATQNHTPSPVSATASPGLSKSPSTASPVVSAAVAPVPVLSLGSTLSASNSTPSSSNVAPVASQNQSGALMLKPLPSNTTSQAASGSTPQTLPLLIQLPLTVTNTQGGSIVTNHSTGVELFPVTSLAAVTTASKAKTTAPATTFVLQKNTPASSTLPLTPTPTLTVARAICPGSSGIVSTPSSGVSMSSARTPTQSISVVGVTSSSSLPVTSKPAATGGQSTGTTTCGPVMVTAMASKTDNQATSSSVAKTPVQVTRTSGSGAVIDLTEDDDDVQVTGVKKGPVPSSLAIAATASSSSSSPSQRPAGAPPPLISATSTPTGVTLRSSPHTNQVGGSQLAALHRSSQDSPSKARTASATSATTPSPVTIPNPQTSGLPPLPSPPPTTGRLPPEAAHTSPPQQPQLKLARVQSQNGIVLSWCVSETDRSCAAVDSYHLYAYHQDHSGQTGLAPLQSQWKKIGEVKALPLPMACTLTQFVSGSTYYFAVRARDVYGRFGPFCEPQCTDVISTTSSN